MMTVMLTQGKKAIFAISLLALNSLVISAAHADQLADIKKGRGGESGHL